ncbi:TetR/AcrR family transcriptional regulator C-terminal domain-containing protein [Nocardiopsis sp. HUAS JQ3]|uniref:TetR/AcrR family transcriptional regulator C-terminal domain-containing protein n=1 Tax=Nocardiopsis sp. HUAS JQ3 TaxID=3061629 RepID=UPI0023A99A46|nr:TetR/AcrR family transcriptional regulator C-terminal domain-containing protein [Nocardiopsis sp. HUAS JQ3]WDZ93368.1 TetR/AcrR family transcriptional regulator C-terminal domain-containing protein [Nocardiopsis sp. HUAS JQ3]
MGQTRVQGKHAGLSRRRVLRTAVGLVDSEGVAALSMRRLARELDVEAMTLYHHVRNKEALEDAIVEHVLAESIREPEASVSWQEAITGYALDLHRGLLAHPGVATLFATRPALTGRNLRELEGLLRILTTAGFTAGTALTIVHATASSVLGQHLTKRDENSGGPAPGSADLPLVNEALEAGFPGVDARVGFTLTALVTGYESLL